MPLAPLLLALFLVMPIAEGVVTVPSNHSVAETTERLIAGVESAGMTVFARIDHSRGAASVGDSLPPMHVVIFGNPRVGTRLMRCSQSMGLELPMRVLIWKDGEAGGVWLSYNDMDHLLRRHNLDDCSEVVDMVSAALARFATGAGR